MMAGTVKIAGHTFKTWQVWAVGVGGAGIAVFIYVKHKQDAAAAASTSTSATATDPVTGLPYSMDDETDPLTGEEYLAEAQEYGSVSAAEAAASSGDSYDSSAYGDLSDDSVGPISDDSGLASLGYTSDSGYASNADWDQAATAGLASLGYSETDVAAALGRYLSGLSLTSDQANLVQVALAEFGDPPSGALPVTVSSTTTTATSGDTGTTTGTTGTTTTTGTTGTTGTTVSGGGGAAAAPTVSGGHVVSVSNNDAVVAWTGTGASSWKVTITGPGAINGHTATVGVPQATYSGLEAGHTYDVTVQPLVAGKAAGKSGVITIDTTK